MTETGPLVTLNTATPAIAAMQGEAGIDQRLRQGRVVFGVDVRATREDGSGASWDGCTPGCYVAGGHLCASGYYRQPESNVGPTVWFRTGDVGIFDAHGYVLLATNLSFSEWDGNFGDAKMTTALLDRLMQHCPMLETGHDSFRFRVGAQTTKRERSRQWLDPILLKGEIPLKAGHFSVDIPGRFSAKINKHTTDHHRSSMFHGHLRLHPHVVRLSTRTRTLPESSDLNGSDLNGNQQSALSAHQEA